MPGLSVFRQRPCSPIFGSSTLITSAPSHASISVHDVPASYWVRSRTVTPATAFSMMPSERSPRARCKKKVDAPPLQIVLVVLLDVLVDLHSHFFAGADLGREIFPPRDLLPRRPGLRVPELRPDKGFGAVEEAFAHRNPHRELGRRATRRQPFEQCGIGGQFRNAVDAQSLVSPGDQENYPDMGVHKNILNTKEQFVAPAVGNKQSALVLHDDEPG